MLKDEERAKEIAEWMHQRLCAAQNLPWEEGDICDDCLESTKLNIMPLLAKVRLEVTEGHCAALCDYCRLDGPPHDGINDCEQPRDGGPRFTHLDGDGREVACQAEAIRTRAALEALSGRK